jgi:hypothetical protein
MRRSPESAVLKKTIQAREAFITSQMHKFCCKRGLLTSSATSSFWVLMVLTMVQKLDFGCF